MALIDNFDELAESFLNPQKINPSKKEEVDITKLINEDEKVDKNSEIMENLQNKDVMILDSSDDFAVEEDETTEPVIVGETYEGYPPPEIEILEGDIPYDEWIKRLSQDVSDDISDISSAQIDDIVV